METKDIVIIEIKKFEGANFDKELVCWNVGLQMNYTHNINVLPEDIEAIYDELYPIVVEEVTPEQPQ